MYTVQTAISFEAAHRLYDVATYSEECRDNVHGHSYNIVVKVGRESLNDASMVIDFKLFKKIVNEEIHDVYDHSCIIRKCDPLAEALVANCKKVNLVEENPTAEWMARLFFWKIKLRLADIDRELSVVEVSVQETENNIATYSKED